MYSVCQLAESSSRCPAVTLNSALCLQNKHDMLPVHELETRQERVTVSHQNIYTIYLIYLGVSFWVVLGKRTREVFAMCCTLCGNWYEMASSRAIAQPVSMLLLKAASSTYCTVCSSLLSGVKTADYWWMCASTNCRVFTSVPRYTEEEIRQKVSTFRQMLMDKEGVITREGSHTQPV